MPARDSASAPTPSAPAPRGAPLRDHGDPEGEYRAAAEDVAVADRSHRLRIHARGRAPEQALAGLVSGALPAPLSPVAPGLWQGRAEGSALLTPKGKMVAELRVLRAGPAPEDGFFLDFPAECGEAALAHMRKYVPPRLAALHEVSAAWAALTVLGPGAAELVSRVASGGRVGRGALDGLEEGDLLHLAAPTAAGEQAGARAAGGQDEEEEEDEDEGDRSGPDGAALTLVRSGEVATAAFDLLGSAEALRGLWDSLTRAGARPVGAAAWETLRLEAGRPAWGRELDEDTIPIEAGVQSRVVDYRKGCFTGQEVLIRIRDRGHVNRRLRGLRMGETAPPPGGTPLFRPGETRELGRVTSAVRSPRFGEVIGLGYVRREVEPPAELRLGAPDGEAVRVHDLDTDWPSPGAQSAWP